MSKEKAFEAELRLQAYTIGWNYIKIPDTKMLNSNNRHKNREQKRPFDAIISAPRGLLAVECKFQYNQLEPHQRDLGAIIENTNGMFVVLRRVEAKTTGYYVAEDTERKELTPRCDSAKELLLKIKDLFQL
jgi:hypothetical protein